MEYHCTSIVKANWFLPAWLLWVVKVMSSHQTHVSRVVGQEQCEQLAGNVGSGRSSGRQCTGQYGTGGRLLFSRSGIPSSRGLSLNHTAVQHSTAAMGGRLQCTAGTILNLAAHSSFLKPQRRSKMLKKMLNYAIVLIFGWFQNTIAGKT